MAAAFAASCHAQPTYSECTSFHDDAARLKCYDAAAQYDPKSLLVFHGSGIENVPPFSINGPWLLHMVSSSQFGVTVYVSGDPTDPGMPTGPENSREMTSYESITGEVYLKIAGAGGDWKVWITPAN